MAVPDCAPREVFFAPMTPPIPSADPAMPTPVLVVDDDPRMCLRLRRILEGTGVAPADIDCAAGLVEARQLLERGRHRLVLVDIGLPDGSGVDLVAGLSVAHPDVQCVVVSAFGAEDLILAALRAGAVGYLLKERDDVEIELSLRSIARGGAPIDPSIARRILGLLAHVSAPPPHAACEGATPLSDREKEVLQLVSTGLTNREIAGSMSLSPLTVESHTKNIYRKLAVGSRTEAVYRARSLGWLA